MVPPASGILIAHVTEKLGRPLKRTEQTWLRRLAETHALLLQGGQLDSYAISWLLPPSHRHLAYGYNVRNLVTIQELHQLDRIFVGGETALEHLDNAGGLYAGFRSEDERLADRLDDFRDDDLIADLDHLAGTRGPDVDDCLT